ncbi:MAG: hypothetical protein GEU71_03915 [Actinobacteria bacterium]|jgi:germination protein M|nr:hypothetical protein [Actinomycetota bacterium]
MSLDGRIRQGLVQAADSVEPNVEGDLMKVTQRARTRRRIQWAAGAVAVAAIGAFLFLGGTDLFDATGDTNPIPPASTGGDGGPTISPTPEDSPSEAVSLTLADLWFTRGEVLFPDTSGLPSAELEGTKLTGEMLLGALVAGTDHAPPEAGLSTSIPEGTKVLGFDIANRIATVDLSSEFVSGGGSLSMRMRVAQVVFTLTQEEEEVEGVLFEIDGEPVDAIGGEGVDVSDPQTRADYEDLLPPIAVTSPNWGTYFVSGETIEGIANVFEATVSWRILDESGEEIANGFATATCGTGCWGDFTTEVEFSIDHSQEGTVEVFESSAENGEPMNVVSVPVTLFTD